MLKNIIQYIFLIFDVEYGLTESSEDDVVFWFSFNEQFFSKNKNDWTF